VRSPIPARGATFVIALARYPFFDDCIEKALVFYAAALKAFTSFYDHSISDSPSAPGSEPFNV
jgi:hypothetical protein